MSEAPQQSDEGVKGGVAALDPPAPLSALDTAVPGSAASLEERLSRPSASVVECLARLSGDVMVLGASGKMGPTLSRMVRRGLDLAGRKATVYAAARFTDRDAEESLHQAGVKTVRVDLLDPEQVRRLPDAENVIYMAGRKFGTGSQPEQAWAMNTVAPVYAADRYRGARTVVFSTGCVYPNVKVQDNRSLNGNSAAFRARGSREEDDLAPLGDYANSCVGRERVFTYFSHQHQSPLCVFRLNYAVDLRYGVLVDVAVKVLNGEPVDVTMGYVNVIWQQDANERAIVCLERASVPPFVVNVTGPETLSIRAVAKTFGTLFGREPRFAGEEAEEALLSDASLSTRLFGPPSVSSETLIRWVAEWLLAGGPLLHKPTQFERFDGKY